MIIDSSNVCKSGIQIYCKRFTFLSVICNQALNCFHFSHSFVRPIFLLHFMMNLHLNDTRSDSSDESHRSDCKGT